MGKKRRECYERVRGKWGRLKAGDYKGGKKKGQKGRPFV